MAPGLEQSQAQALAASRSMAASTRSPGARFGGASGLSEGRSELPFGFGECPFGLSLSKPFVSPSTSAGRAIGCPGQARGVQGELRTRRCARKLQVVGARPCARKFCAWVIVLLTEGLRARGRAPTDSDLRARGRAPTDSDLCARGVFLQRQGSGFFAVRAFGHRGRLRCRGGCRCGG